MRKHIMRLGLGSLGLIAVFIAGYLANSFLNWVENFRDIIIPSLFGVFVVGIIYTIGVMIEKEIEKWRRL